MRRFSGLVARLHRKSRVSELTFLLNAEPPIPARVENHPLNLVNKDSFSPANSSLPPPPQPTEKVFKKLTMAQAMQRLHSAVMHQQYSAAEDLFQAIPQLIERQSAFRLLIKIYCEQFDFLSAKALLFSSENNRGIRKSGDAGVGRFVAHLTFSAKNARLIDETLQRMVLFHAQNGTEISPKLVVTALNGLLFLGELQLFKEAWADLSDFQQRHALESQVLRLLLSENWSEARALWHEISSDGKVCGGKMVWYTALRYFLTEFRSSSSVAAVLLIMKAEQVMISPDFTALLLRHLPQLGLIRLDQADLASSLDEDGTGEAKKDFDAAIDQWSAREWLDYAQNMGWPLDVHCADQALFAAWHKRLPPRVFRDVVQIVMPNVVSKKQRKRQIYRAFELKYLSKPPRRLKLAMGARFNPFWHEINRAANEKVILSTLRSMHKRGMTISYDLLVLSFEKAIRVSPPSQVYKAIENLTTIIKQEGYPIHSAGIDLSVVELHAKANHYQPIVVQALVKEYLAQYPLVNNQLGQLTRLAVVLLNAHEASAALAVVDSLRESSQRPFGPSNHDCASLQVLLMARYRMGEPLLPVLHDLVTSRIYLDQTFFRKVKHLLSLANEEAHILSILAEKNEQLVAQAKQDARDVHSIY